MACDTFIKIANKCKRHFVVLQPGETEPFIEEIVRTMRKITNDLSPQQVHTFYEACGHMISAQGQKNVQERLIENLMAYPNMAVCKDSSWSEGFPDDMLTLIAPLQWNQIIQQANQNPSILEDGDTIKIIGNIMKTNVSACSSIGSYFYPQIGRIYLDMLSMYRATSQMISEAVTRDGMYRIVITQQRCGLTCISYRCDRYQDAQGSRIADGEKGDPKTHRHLCPKS